MWIFTTTGFVSAVSDGKQLVVRSRDRLSLVPISTFAKAEIKKSPVSDYPYRLTRSNELFAEWVSGMAKSIDYRNFKSEVADLRGDDFAHPLMKAWSAMHEVEDTKAMMGRDPETLRPMPNEVPPIMHPVNATVSCVLGLTTHLRRHHPSVQ